MDALKRVERQMQVLKKKEDKLREDKLKILKRKLVQCVECGKNSCLSAWTFIQGHWYVTPRGCTEGGYWDLHTTDNCFMVCPICNAEVRILDHPERDAIVYLLDVVGQSFGKKDIFKKVEERHQH